MSGWLAQHFFNPSIILPWGAALLAVPIVIHLINRMRFRRVRFAAMEFLLQSQRRNRRRLLFEQLLLLLLRVAVVAGLLALVGRLVLDPSEMSFFRGAQAHHLVLLDDSGSMRDRWGNSTAFAQALDVVKKLAAEGARRPDSQKLTLLKLSDPLQPLLVERNVNDLLLSELGIKLENLQCSHRAPDLAASLDAAAKLLSEDKSAIRHLHLVSDFRLSDWQDSKAVGSTVRALANAGVSVNFVRTVPQRHENLAVTELSGNLQVAAAGVPVRLNVRVKNFGQQVASDVRLSVLQDGRKLPLTIKFDRIEPGKDADRDFDVTFNTPEKHKLEVALESDAVDDDNTRYLAVNIAGSYPVLVIDGDPSGEEGAYVADALAAQPVLTGITPTVEGPDALRNRPLERFQCIYLVNVPELRPDAIEALSEYVRAGGGLVWFLGDLVKPSFYNEKLYLQGQGLFPVPLATARRDLPPADEATPGADLHFASHPLFRVFEGQDNPFVESVSVATFWPVADTWSRDDNERKDGVSTVGTLRNKQPILFEHRLGNGRIITALTSAGPQWNNWVQNPSYVVFQLELEKYVARNDRTLERRIVGEPIEFSLDPAVFTDAVEIASPAATGEKVTRLKAAPKALAESQARPARPADVRLAATYHETDQPGIYSVKLLDHNQTTLDRWISYNVPIHESDLELVSNSQIRKSVGEDARLEIQASGSFQWIEGKDSGQEIRKILIASLLALLLVEQLMAYRVSYHPKRAEQFA